MEFVGRKAAGEIRRFLQSVEEAAGKEEPKPSTNIIGKQDVQNTPSLHSCRF